MPVFTVESCFFNLYLSCFQLRQEQSHFFHFYGKCWPIQPKQNVIEVQHWLLLQLP